MFDTLHIEGKEKLDDLPIVCEFPYAFLDDITDLPLERDVEFAID